MINCEIILNDLNKYIDIVNDYNIMKDIINNDNDINYNKKGELNILNHINNCDIIKLLIDKNININHIDSDGENVLFNPCISYKKFKYLINNTNININILNKYNENLYYVDYYNFKIIKLLVKLNLNYLNFSLLECNYFNSYKHIKFFINNGININKLKFFHNMNSLHYSDNYKCVKILIKNGINKNCGIKYIGGSINILKMFIDNDYDINFVDDICYINNLTYDILKLLIENGKYISDNNKKHINLVDEKSISLINKAPYFYNKSHKYINSKTL